MRTEKYKREMIKRIARAEQEANATILRALTRVLAVLERERTEYQIHRQRLRRANLVS